MNFKLSLIATASVLLLSMVASCKHSNLPVNMYGMNQFYPSPCRTNYVCGVHVKVLDPCTIQYFHPSQHYSNHQNM